MERRIKTIQKLIKRIINKNNQSESSAAKQIESMTTTEDPESIMPPFIQDTTTITLEQALQFYKPEFVSTKRKMNAEDLKKYILYAVAIGDISGSKYEGCPYPGYTVSEIAALAKSNDSNNGAHPVYEGYKTIDLFTDGHRFTDDTVLTIAVYKATQEIVTNDLTDGDEFVKIYAKYLREYTRLYPDAGYADGFEKWAWSETTERNFSYGNGACMRVGSVAALFDDIEDVIRYAYYSALPSHSHKEGIKGAICTAVIYWMLAQGATKDDIKKYFAEQYPADNGHKINSATKLQDLVDMNRVNPWSTLSVLCQTSLPEAIINFLESDSFEGCLRNNYRYLTDRDTIAAISAPMAAIYYGNISVGELTGGEIIKRFLDKKLLRDIKM
jgi:ADP-ribosylglycohydrolase